MSASTQAFQEFVKATGPMRVSADTYYNLVARSMMRASGLAAAERGSCGAPCRYCERTTFVNGQCQNCGARK